MSRIHGVHLQSPLLDGRPGQRTVLGGERPVLLRRCAVLGRQAIAVHDHRLRAALGAGGLVGPRHGLVISRSLVSRLRFSVVPGCNGFVIAGYPLKITSVRAVTWSDVQQPSFIDGSQGYEFGYQFTVESDPSIKMSAEMDIMSESPICGLIVGSPLIPADSSLQYTQLCRDTYPSGLVKVTIRELAVLIENTWQSTWTP